jgi:multidrug resistance efflux pump
VVKKGQLLATLDAPELRAQRAEAEAKVLNAESQRAEAEAKLAGAQSTYEKLKAASATPGVIAGNELIQAEKIVDATRAQVGQLRVLSRRPKPRSKSSGIWKRTCK